MRITVVGAGYVGLSNALLFATRHDVTALDIDAGRVAMLERRESPLDDAGIREHLARPDLRFSATLDAEAAYAARELWQTINLPNLVENILPTRVRASLVLRKDYDHTVQRVRMRKI